MLNGSSHYATLLRRELCARNASFFDSLKMVLSELN